MRVWYEPSQGVRFAGVCLGDGTLPNTSRVALSGHYWRWKHGQSAGGRIQPAIARDRLLPRVERCAELGE